MQKIYDLGSEIDLLFAGQDPKKLASELDRIEGLIHHQLAEGNTPILILRDSVKQLRERAYQKTAKEPWYWLALRHLSYSCCTSRKPFKMETKPLHKLVPKSLLEGHHLRRIVGTYLTFTPGDHNINNWQLSVACTEILYQGVRFASLNLNQEYFSLGRYSRGSLMNPAEIIASLVADGNCQLQYLDLTFSAITPLELITILEAIPPHSPLKCIHVDTPRWDQDNFMSLVKYLEGKPKNIIILGLKNEKYPDEVARLKKVHDIFAKDIEFTMVK